MLSRIKADRGSFSDTRQEPTQAVLGCPSGKRKGRLALPNTGLRPVPRVRPFFPLLNNPQIILSSQLYKIRPMLEVKTAALPASLRRTNQRTVISLLFRLGSASRADLAKAAGISQPTAGKIISELPELVVLGKAGGRGAVGKRGGSGSDERRVGP